MVSVEWLKSYQHWKWYLKSYLYASLPNEFLGKISVWNVQQRLYRLRETRGLKRKWNVKKYLIFILSIILMDSMLKWIKIKYSKDRLDSNMLNE